MSTQNLIEQLGYDLAKKLLDEAPSAKSFISGTVKPADGWDKKHQKYVMCDGVYKFHWNGKDWDIFSYAWHDFVNNVIDLSQLRTQLAEYEAMLAHDGNYVQGQSPPAPIDQLTFDALDKILERAPDPSADFYVADTDTYFSLETGTYFNHAHQKWLESKYRTEQELRENYESVFNLLDVVEQVVALEPTGIF